MTANFSLLHPEWPDIHESAIKAEAAVYVYPRTASFYARRTLELMMGWLYKHD
jgi:type I restriction enzyme R subunit